MNRKQLITANDELLKRRQELEAVQEPAPISQPASTWAERNQATINQYFEALHAGEVVTERVVVSGCRARWERFQSDRHPTLAKAVKTIMKFYNERIDAGGGLLLTGGHGCGKTELARAIKELYGIHAVFWDERELVKAIQDSYGHRGGGQSEASIFNQCRRARLLIYDDLGAYETDNEAFIQNIYRGLFDGRFEAGRATLITTNLSGTCSNGGRSEFEERVGARNFSRILGQIEHTEFWVDLTGVPDYRLRNFARNEQAR